MAHRSAAKRYYTALTCAAAQASGDPPTAPWQRPAPDHPDGPPGM